MVKIGDRIGLASNAATRSGVVTAVSGSLIHVRWDNGTESSVIPGPGTLTVDTAAKPAKKAGPKKGKAAKAAGKKAAAKKAAPAKKNKAVKTKAKKSR